MASVKGGDKFDAAIQAVVDRFSKAANLEVGFFENSTYPDGTSVPMVAAINEFGKPEKGQPPRPFFRNMIAAKSPGWPSQLANLIRINNGDVVKAMNLMGEGVKGQLQNSIRELTSPPLAQSTIDRKGFDKPLIEHSVMINSVGYNVHD